jgi:ABC-2 type transport system permease protein
MQVAEFTPVFRSEWLKIRTLRSLVVTLAVIVLVTGVFSALGSTDSDDPDFDALAAVFFGVNLGQIAAIAFGTTAFAAEFRGGALRVSLAAVPRRGRWYAAKLLAVAAPAAVAGLVAGAVSYVVGTAVLGAKADAVSGGKAARAVVGCGVYVTLMALLAAGLTAVLRSGVATSSILIPLLLVVSFVVGNRSNEVADFLPDRAGQVVFHETWDGTLGPWTGLAVTALWTACALLAGAWSVRRRDA